MGTVKQWVVTHNHETGEFYIGPEGNATIRATDYEHAWEIVNAHNATLVPAPAPTDTEREAVARAIRSVPIGPFGPNSLHMLNLGAQTHLNSTEALALADAALSATRPATVSAEAIYEAIAESHPDDRVDPLMESVYRIQANDVVKRLRAAGIEVTE